MKAKHKLGRLSLKTTNGMLANPETPPAVRAPCREISRRTAEHRGDLGALQSLRGDLFIFDERSKLSGAHLEQLNMSRS